MKGLLGLAAVCLLVAITEAQIIGWTATGFTVSGTNTATVTMTYGTKVVETSAAAAPIVTLAATKTGSATTINYAFTATGNPNSVGNIATVTTGAITLASGKSIDYETTKSIVFVVTATESSPPNAAVGTATVTIEIKNKLEFGQDQYGYCVPDGSTAGTQIGTFKASDTGTSETVTLSSNLGATDDLKYDATTGVLSVNTGKTLAQKTTGGYQVTLTATAGGTISSDNGQSIVWVAVATCSGATQVTAVFAVVGLAFASALFF